MYSVDVDRFNPAYAGNIDMYRLTIEVQEVQPRVCGEYQTGEIQKRLLSGSTPRMRGIFT